MARKKKKSNRFSTIAFGLLVLAAVVAVALLLFMRSDTGTTATENALGSLLAPVQDAFSRVTGFFGELTSGARNYQNMLSENQANAREIEELKIQLTALEEAGKENERLKALLDAQEANESLDPIYARVIARDPGVWFNTFSINRGTLDGIAVNMAVITGDGLVGRIIEVGLNYAKVLSIVDARSSVSCMVERTRDNGIMNGDNGTNPDVAECTMQYLPSINDIMPGDKILTSGIDQIYPKGLTVGTVTSISRQADSVTGQSIVVSPSVDFLHLEEVLVLRLLIETNEALPVVPTPTPYPTAEPTPEPTPIANPEDIDLSDENTPWSRPTVMPNADVAVPDTQPTPTPVPTVDPATLLPEDAWALEATPTPGAE